MFPIRNLLRTNPQIIKNVVQQRNMSAIATPARNKVGAAEKVILAGCMFLGWTTVPMYVLVNMKNYRHKD